MLDLLDVNLGNPSLQPAHAATLDPWGFPQPVPQSPPTRPQVSVYFLHTFDCNFTVIFICCVFVISFVIVTLLSFSNDLTLH